MVYEIGLTFDLIVSFVMISAGVPCNGSYEESNPAAQNLLQRGKI